MAFLAKNLKIPYFMVPTLSPWYFMIYCNQLGVILSALYADSAKSIKYILSMLLGHFASFFPRFLSAHVTRVGFMPPKHSIIFAPICNRERFFNMIRERFPFGFLPMICKVFIGSFACFFFSFVGINPLRGNSFTANPYFYSILNEIFFNRPCRVATNLIHNPSIASFFYLIPLNKISFRYVILNRINSHE